VSRLSSSGLPLLLLALSGCASLPKYQAPDSDVPQAELDLTDIDSPTVCVGGKLYDVEKGPDNRISVPSERRVAVFSWVYMKLGNTSYSCMPGISFRPEEGRAYYFRQELANESCRVEVYRKGGDNRIGLDLEPTIGPAAYCN
jgi:hypothetical protein